MDGPAPPRRFPRGSPGHLAAELNALICPRSIVSAASRQLMDKLCRAGRHLERETYLAM
jgi:hypothetical protein